MFVFEIIHVPYLTCCSSSAKVLKSCTNQHHHSAFVSHLAMEHSPCVSFLVVQKHPSKTYKHTSGTSPKLSHGTSRCLIQVGYLTMWNRPIEMKSWGVGCGFLTGISGCPKRRYTGCIGMSIIGLLFVAQVTYYERCNVKQLHFSWSLCVFGGRHWSSKNASKSCCLVMKGELGSPICRCPSGGGNFIYKFTTLQMHGKGL